MRSIDTIIADQEKLRVRGAVYLPIQEEQNVKSYSKGRDLQLTTTTNDPIDFPFQFNFKLPDPRKERIIWERDALGKIIHSKPPELPHL